MGPSTLQRFRANWATQWRSGVAILVLATLGVAGLDLGLPLVASRILGKLADASGGRGSYSDAWSLLTIAIIAGVAGLACWRAASLVVVWRQPKLLRTLTVEIFESLSPRSMKFFSERFAGAIVTQAKRYVSAYETFDDAFQFEILPMALRMLASLAILAVVLPVVAGALAVFIVLLVGSVVILVRRIRPLNEAVAASDSKVTARLADALGNILVIKAFAQEERELDAYSEFADHQSNARRTAWRWGEHLNTYQGVLLVTLELGVLALSIWLLSRGSAKFENVVLAQLYTGRIISDLYHVQYLTRNISRSLADAQEMTDILNLQPDIVDLDPPEPLNVTRGEIHFERIGFCYHQPPLFDDLDLRIEAGQRVGLVGHSGSGKTTLVKLVMRFSDLTSGRVLIDGQDIARCAQRELRSQLAYVPQEPLLFHRSLAENISYSDPEAGMERIERAAKLARADEFIARMPNGYETMVGERGVKLSGGERQRIAIARAILSTAPILLLDEATAALDSRSELLITEAMEDLMADRTTIVIAHRLSTVRHLDRIIVLDKGRVVEDGPHEELLAIGGGYAELWQHQAGGLLGDG